MIELIQGDCLQEQNKIKDGSVDLILTDLPYGTMEGQSKTGIYHNGEEKHEWDSIIDTDKIMQVANRILRKNGKMILFAQEPFTRELINKAIPNLPFNYRAIWLKDTLGSFMRSKRALLYRTEDILIFSKNHEFEGLHPLRPYFKEVFEYIGHTKKTILEQVGQRADHVFRFNSSQFDLCTIETYEALICFYCIDKMECFKNFAELKTIDEQFKNEFASTFNLWQGGKYKDNVFEYIGHTKKTILGQVGQRADHVFRFNSSQFDLCTNETYEALIYYYCIDKMEGFKMYEELEAINATFNATFNLWEGGKFKSNVLEYKKDYDGLHPTQKPILLLEDLIKTFSNEGNLVVDLTMGSGSTGVACKNTNRSFIGIEKDEVYFKIAEQRINARALFS